MKNNPSKRMLELNEIMKETDDLYRNLARKFKQFASARFLAILSTEIYAKIVEASLENLELLQIHRRV